MGRKDILKRMNILLSIRPEFVEKIISGEKRYEFRRRVWARPCSKVLVYATSPIKRVVGEFDVDDIICDTVLQVWDRCKKYSGIDFERFNMYFKDSALAYAICINRFVEYSRPRTLVEFGLVRPPQSFCFIK